MLKYAYAVPNLLQGNYWKLHRLRKCHLVQAP